MTYILQPYDDLLEYVLEHGKEKQDRTGIGTLSVFGTQTRYDISEYFPLLTRRKVWPKAIFAELLWMISGSTNIKDLQNLGSHIWDQWQSEEFEQKNNFVPGSLGPVYGFQLRHFGGLYWQGEKEDFTYGYGGVDQLQQVVDLLRSDPDSRRNLFSLWNPKDLYRQKLPVCHYSFQVYVDDGKLSGMLTQRSCDLAIGCPANIQCYSTLLYMLAQQTGYQPGEFIHSIGSAHCYLNQLEGVQEYVCREVVSSPKLELKPAKTINDYAMDNFNVIGYNPLGKISIPVAV
nr:Thymidylate synthase [uncultured bacterium]